MEVQTASGRREQKIFRVRPLAPQQAAGVEGFFRMAPGYNTLRVKGIGGLAACNLTDFAAQGRSYRRTHYFHPQRFAFHAGKASSFPGNVASPAKNAARLSAKRQGKNFPNANTLKALSKARHITILRPVKTKTYGAVTGRFYSPKPDEMIAPGSRYTIVWSAPYPGEGLPQKLYLVSIHKSAISER